MRWVRLTVGDVRFQIKYGFYFIYAVFCAFYIFLLFAFPESWRVKAASVMIYSDPAAMGLFFMGAIVLLEKSQRVLNALAVAPVKVSEYMAAKVASLMLISIVVSWLIALAAGLENMGAILLSTALTSVVFSLLGLIVATRINSLNQYVLATVPAEVVCFVPPILYLFAPNAAMRWFPLNGSVALIAGSSQNALLDVALLLVTVACLWGVAHHETVKMWRRLGGVKL